MRKNIFLLILFILTAAYASAQNNAVNSCSIYGFIFDSISNKPVEYANIVIYKAENDSLVAGTVANKKGYFILEKLPEGSYYTQVSFIGYKNKKSNSFTISPDAKKAKLDTIKLCFDFKNLKVVSVEGVNKVYEQTFDKKSYLIDDRRNAGANTVLDLLRTLPSITVDEDGSVKFRGQEPTILIDDQPAELLYPKLEMLPAAMVDKIEFLEPSARLESAVGTINIKLKKPRENGLSGAVYSNNGFSDLKSLVNFSHGINLNVKHNKVILYMNVYYGGQNFDINHTTASTYLYNDSTFISSYQRYADGFTHNGSANAGCIYQISKLKKLTFTLTSGISDYRNNTYESNIETQNDQIREDLITKKYYDFFSTNNAASVNYSQIPKDNSGEFNIKGSYSRSENKNTTQENNRYYFYNYHPSDSVPLLNYPENKQKDSYLFECFKRKNIDTIGRWEVGIQSNGTFVSSDYKFLFDNHLIPDFSYSEEMLNMKHALYSSLGLSHKRFRFDAGLRLAMGMIRFDVNEFTNGKDTLIHISRDFPMMIPSLNIGYKLKTYHELKLRYSYDVQMPYYLQFDPYINKYNPRAWTSGNSQLDPVKTHKITFGYLYSPKAFTASFDVFTNYSPNYVNEVMESLNNYTIITKPYNIGKLLQTGITLSGSGNIYKWFLTNLTVDLYHSKLDATELPEALSSINLIPSGLISQVWSVSANLYMSFTIKKKYSLNINLKNPVRNPTIGGYYNSGLFSTFSLSGKFLKKKLNVSISAQNPIEKWSVYTYNQDYLGRKQTQTWSTNLNMRIIKVSLRYSFNKGDRDTMKVQE